MDSKALRESVVIDEHPILSEDGGNLAAVLLYLNTEHPVVFDELQAHLRGVVPGFQRLSVKPRGGPGRVMAFWEEEGVDQPLTLADVSDGTLRLLCWMTLALAPNVPTLVCIDEPDQGVHPRTLPKLAALFKKLSERTQVLIATHNSYFLSQFDLAQIAVMRKEEGRAVWIKPGDSAALRANLEEFGVDELERMHRSDELEHLS